MEKAAIMGACAASSFVALNVAMQQFAGAAGWGTETGNNSDDDDYPPVLLAANMNAQFLALMCVEGLNSSDVFGATHPNKWYVRPRCTEWWDLFLSKPDDHEPHKWRSLFRVMKPTFEYICSLVRKDMETFKIPSNFSHIKGRELTVEKQAAIALRRLSSGDPVSCVGELFGVGNATVSKITWRFIKAIVNSGRQHVKWPEGEDMKRVKADFEQLAGFPNCCGVVGSTHIPVSLPPEESPIQWMDRACKVSMVSQAIVDASMRFLDVCIGWPGASEDSTVLQNSTFYRLCQSGQRLNGPEAVLLEKPVREYILGNVGHPLLPWLVIPYPEATVTPDGQLFERTPQQAPFNERHEATRMVVDRAFAYLKGMWRMLCKANRCPNTAKLSSLVFACCLLHNIALDCGEVIDENLILAGHHDEGYSPVYFEQDSKSDGWQFRDVLAECLAFDDSLQ